MSGAMDYKRLTVKIEPAGSGMVELLVDGEPEDDTYFATRADVERFLASAGA